MSILSYVKTSSMLSNTLVEFENAIIQEKQSLIRNELIVAQSLIETTLKNNTNKEAAKAEVIRLLSGLRYLKDKSGYFFAYEEKSDGFYFGFHGTKPQLNDQKTDINQPDIKGYAFRQDLIKNAQEEKYVKYYYKRPNSDLIIPKIASSVYIPELNWVLVTGIYVDNIEKQMNLIKDEINSQINESLLIAFISTAVLIIVTTLMVLPLVKRVIIDPIFEFQTGLKGFFKYLNKTSDSVKPIQLSTQDELGRMAAAVNENIVLVQKNLDEDAKLINTTIDVLGKFQEGDLSQRLNVQVSNPSLVKLQSVLNNMAQNLEENIDNVLVVLEKYTKYDYRPKVNIVGLQKHLLKLAQSVNNLGESTTQMLIHDKKNGLALEKSSASLLSNVDNLNESANEAASSLEETAAALEQMTANIRSNTQNIAEMANLANEVTSSANSGARLANETTTAMENIDEQVIAINEAITVIDQIAFQTNILSLNAAVEAATAGEAGKGFAVVAQEVRNLASRSAEAAKEIKNMVENATNKANQGKNIAEEMIDGYKHLNERISHTIELIKDVENSSKEQLSGIEQINSAVSQLDLQTQENAAIASGTKEIAMSTDEMAKLIVYHANKKEFDGKDEIKSEEE
ncbi:chemotaxis protein [Candidatus Marinarcus aquaticus]|uniref:Chemotaxis protein n=2 Tax=Candidatus Marinarcus aquaticus TaxID=2044504 RepID=A0A4Q0XQ63_9BACT|nr:chemotaxis protein [Candidatus Marinarcus aquaticus]